MKSFYTYLLLFSCLSVGAQHSPLVSHYMLNGLVINPAYTGSREVFTANAMYRNQWVGFEGAPVSQIVSAHTPLKNKSIAVGMLFDNEKIGVSNYTGLTGNVAYRVQLNDATLSFGVSAGLRMLSAQYSSLTTNQDNDLAFAGDLRSNIRPDFGAGVYYSNNKYFVGVSVPSFMSRQYHITDEQLTIRNRPGDYNFILQGGYLFELNDMFKLKPGALVRFTPAGNKQFDVNANVIYNDRFWVGLSYRHREALVALLEFQVNQQFKVAYVYDYSLSYFRQFAGGSHEVGLQYEFGFKVKSKDPRFF